MTTTQHDRQGATGGGAHGLDPLTRDALAELMLAMADDEFVLGYWDSEWTGIAPVLEEDVAWSSLAQDELGHARALYELLGELLGTEPDELAYGRPVERYRHARLLDHPRGDWAFSVARRFLYDTADAARLDALAGSSFQPLAELVAKMRREESYHLLHLQAWVNRLASAGEHARGRLTGALGALWPDAVTVFTPLAGEARLLAAGIMPEPLAATEQRWLAALAPLFAELALPFPFRRSGGRLEATFPPPAAGGRSDHSADFGWLWGEFTMVYRSEPGATW
jgi:ring-1,2-phenylacetyl-CoA epoxidase subunit PaaC